MAASDALAPSTLHKTCGNVPHMTSKISSALAGEQTLKVQRLPTYGNSAQVLVHLECGMQILVRLLDAEFVAQD